MNDEGCCVRAPRDGIGGGVMQKQVIGRSTEISDTVWLDLESRAAVEITSEDPARPIESALRPGEKAGWRAADPGPQVIRLVFNQPQRISQVRLKFTERERESTPGSVCGGGRE